MTKSVSGTLEIRDGTHGAAICCRRCGHALAPAGTSWKAAAHLRQVSMRGLSGNAYNGSGDAILRQFICNGCGTLLDSEMALADDPFLEDSVQP